MTNEIFSTNNLLKDFQSYDSWILPDTNLDVINDKLTFVKEYTTDSPWKTRVDILIMNNYGVQESWTKEFVLCLSTRRWKLWEFWNDGGVVIVGLDHGSLVLY